MIRIKIQSPRKSLTYDLSYVAVQCTFSRILLTLYS